MSKRKGEPIKGDAAWEKCGMRFTQAEYEELLALRTKSQTQVLSSKEQDRRWLLETKKRELG